MTSTLTTQLCEYVSAGFSGIWITTFEPDEAAEEIRRLCIQREWRLYRWDCDQGADTIIEGNAPPIETSMDPITAIHAVGNIVNLPVQTSILVLENLHHFMGPDVIQALVNAITVGKLAGRHFVILSPITTIPIELSKLFVVVEHELPTRKQLEEIATTLTSDPAELPDEQGMEQLLLAASGLTRYEAEGAFSLSIIRDGKIDPTAVWELKTQTIRKSGILTLHRGEERFENLGGMAALKDFARRSILSTSRARPRGIMLVGVPGAGKSAFAKALGNETGRPTLLLDIGALMGGIVGQTEENTRRALKIADAMAPCVLFVDEVEKALAGMQSSGQTDSGVSARLFGTLLTWLNDHTSDVYFICTSNNIAALPSEFTRAERFDATFFLDLPGQDQRDVIWDIYTRAYAVDRGDEDIYGSEQWTGAEIKACCRLASMLNVPLDEAAKCIIPEAVKNAERVESLQAWASGRCLDPESPGIYRRAKQETTKGRRLTRQPA